MSSNNLRNNELEFTPTFETHLCLNVIEFGIMILITIA